MKNEDDRFAAIWCLMYLSKFKNVFDQIDKCIWPNFDQIAELIADVFVKIANVFVQIMKCLFLQMGDGGSPFADLQPQRALMTSNEERWRGKN